MAFELDGSASNIIVIGLRFPKRRGFWLVRSTGLPQSVTRSVSEGERFGELAHQSVVERPPSLANIFHEAT